MLDRVKKKQYEGFKEFVLNLEVTVSNVRSQIFLNGLLEDPLFMSHVLKNIRDLDDFLNLPSDEIDEVMNCHDSMSLMLAKSLYGMKEDRFQKLGNTVPRWFSRIKEELRFLKAPTAPEQEAAQHFILKNTRRLQGLEKIQGFPWKLPPQEIFFPKTYPDGRMQVIFENGSLAAEGDMLKNKRFGFWRHFYETGKILGQGEYTEGEKTGTWVFYHSNGLHRAQGKYKADIKEGLWQEWDRSGVMQEVEYLNGVRKD